MGVLSLTLRRGVLLRLKEKFLGVVFERLDLETGDKVVGSSRGTSCGRRAIYLLSNGGMC